MTVTLKIYRGDDVAVYPGLDADSALESALDNLGLHDVTRVEIIKED